MRAPPIRSGLTVTVASIFLPKRFSSAVVSSAVCSGESGNALSIVAFATFSASSFRRSNSSRICGISAMRSASISTRRKLRPSPVIRSPAIDKSSASLSCVDNRGFSSAAATRESATIVFA
jgi:hypothetical protein